MPHEGRPGLVVRPAALPGPPAGLRDDPRSQHHAVALDVEGHRARGRPLPAPHGVPDDVRHPQVALDHGHLGSFGRRRLDAGEQLAGREQHDAGLAEARQHLLDVTEEHRRWADHEHAAAGDAVAVGVQQVGRAVQRHRRLAGARAALDDEDAGQRRAHHAVLLRLQGGDDVAHPAGAVRREGAHQRSLAGDHGEARPLAAPRRRAARRRGRSPCARGWRGDGAGPRPAARRPSPGRTRTRRAPASRRAAAAARRPRARAAPRSGGPRRRGRAGRTPAGPRRSRGGRCARCARRRRRHARRGPRAWAPVGRGGPRRGRRVARARNVSSCSYRRDDIGLLDLQLALQVLRVGAVVRACLLRRRPRGGLQVCAVRRRRAPPGADPGS